MLSPNLHITGFGVLFALLATGAHAGDDVRPGCSEPATAAVYPVNAAQHDLPLGDQSRYEIESCGEPSPHIRGLGFRDRTNRPSLVVDTDGDWITLTIQTGPVLAIQLLGGSSDSIYIFNFRNKEPTLVARDRTAGGVAYSERHLDHPVRDFVLISVPPKVYPDGNGALPKVRPHQYRLEIQ